MKKTIRRVLRHKPQMIACFLYWSILWLVKSLLPALSFWINVFAPSGFIVFAYWLYYTRPNAAKRHRQFVKFRMQQVKQAS